MKTKLLVIPVIAMMLLGMLAVLPMASAVIWTNLKVVNLEDGTQEIHKWSDVDHPGDSFDISIVAENVTGLFGWELVLRWTPGVINCTAETCNMKIWGTGNALGPWDANPINNTSGKYHQSVTGRAPGTPQSGTFWLANLTFIIVEEPDYMSVVHTQLHLEKPPGYVAYCLLSALPKPNDEIPHNYVHGEYYYHWAPPTEIAYLEVVPKNTIIAGKNIYKNPVQFSVDIMIRDVASGWRLAGIEFLLRYNTSVLDVLSVDGGDAGGFLYPFTAEPGGTWFYEDVFESLGKIRVAYVVIDIPHYTPAHGEGKVATITFNCTLQEKFPTSVSSDLNVTLDIENGMTSYFINWKSDEVPYLEAKDGYYEMKGYVIGRVIDLTTQYPDPYGGQGPGMPSDMFWPQKQVELNAYVTYNEWPVQQKIVAFEIDNPQGDLVDLLTGITDTNGKAHVSFRIPWPCDDPESLFGVWTVKATVDLYCIIVNDTLEFHFDYLVHWLKVTTDKIDYGHCEYINLNVTFGSHSQQAHWVLITVVGHDEVNVPYGVDRVWILVEGAEYCTLKEYTVQLSIHVPKYAAAGTSTLYVNAYSAWPAAGGSPWAPTYVDSVSGEPPTVNILAAWAP